MCRVNVTSRILCSHHGKRVRVFTFRCAIDGVNTSDALTREIRFALQLHCMYLSHSKFNLAIKASTMSEAFLIVSSRSLQTVALLQVRIG